MPCLKHITSYLIACILLVIASNNSAQHPSVQAVSEILSQFEVEPNPNASEYETTDDSVFNTWLFFSNRLPLANRATHTNNDFFVFSRSVKAIRAPPFVR
ncbi:hypothetical protein HR060_15535 [Catenovulum sp. SM1970]|uniref:hypothetical protein n=1 Tax=Marinifaba aquimaris TaxID=2741323 RepID=UPI001571A17D|nr:hypothetical protein [Marinifaba aquimaris]NTS78263.1 hypothetical protein [Marinifaba aquimaris]